jgi:hypothetical protein
MLSSKLSRISWLTTLLLMFALLAAPLVGITAQTIKSDKEGQASPDLKALLQYGVDLTEMARRGSLEPVNGYDPQIQSTLRILARETRNNPVLLGEDEAARISIVEGVAQRIAEGHAPASLANKRVFNLSLESLSAGAADSEEFNRRFEAVLSEARNANGRIILFINGLDALVVEDDSVNASAADMLEAALAHDELRLVGASTPESFEAKLAHREGFKGKLQEIFVDSVTEDTAKAGEEKDKANEEAQDSEAFVGDKIAPELNELIQSSNSTSESVHIILQGDALNSSGLRAFIKRNGIRITGQYSNLNAQAIQIPARLVNQLADFNQVSYLSLDREMASQGRFQVHFNLRHDFSSADNGCLNSR